MNGILLGYRVLYKTANKPMNGFRNVTVNSSLLNAEITGLEFFTKYELRVLAFTVIGDGNISDPVFCMTDESGNIAILYSARLIVTEDTVFIQWAKMA